MIFLVYLMLPLPALLNLTDLSKACVASEGRLDHGFIERDLPDNSETDGDDTAVLTDILNRPAPREATSSLIERLTGHIPPAQVITEAIKRSASSAMEQRIFGQRLGDIIIEGAAGTATGQGVKTLARMALGMSGVGILELAGAGALGGIGTAVVKEYFHQRKEFNTKKVEEAGLADAKADLKRAFRINGGRMVRAAARGAIFGAVGGVVGVGIAEMALEGISPLEWWKNLMANTKLPEIFGGGQAPEATATAAAPDATSVSATGTVVPEAETSSAPSPVSTPEPTAAETPAPAAQTPVPTAKSSAVPQAPAIPTAPPDIAYFDEPVIARTDFADQLAPDTTHAVTTDTGGPSLPETPTAPAAPAPEIHKPEPISHVTAPNGAVVSGSTLDNSLTYNGQSWHLAENGIKNLGHLLTTAGQSPDIDHQILNAKLQEAAALWANGQLDPDRYTDLYRLFHFSNGTGNIYRQLFNKDTISSLMNLGIISE